MGYARISGCRHGQQRRIDLSSVFQIHGDDASGASLDVSITCMRLSSRQQSIVTSHAYLAVEEISQGRIPMLLIHGNSFCRGVFRHQWQGQLANTFAIAFDLPGHGGSSNAPDTTRGCSRPGLADAAVELLDKPR
jgi:pimeloyl-ACP methyl ester carboxylesterase